MNEKTELIGLNRDELAAELAKLGEKPFRAKQIWHWLYNQGVTDFAAMTNLSKDLQQKNWATAVQSPAPRLTPDKFPRQNSKWLLEFAMARGSKWFIFLEEDHGAVCISTQVGCAVGCTFCHIRQSAHYPQPDRREKSSGSFWLRSDAYNEWPTPANEPRFLSNVVVMAWANRCIIW